MNVVYYFTNGTRILEIYCKVYLRTVVADKCIDEDFCIVFCDKFVTEAMNRGENVHFDDLMNEVFEMANQKYHHEWARAWNAFLSRCDLREKNALKRIYARIDR